MGKFLEILSKEESVRRKQAVSKHNSIHHDTEDHAPHDDEVIIMKTDGKTPCSRVFE